MEKILLPVDLAQPDKAEALVKVAAEFGRGRDVQFTLLYVLAMLPGYLTADLPAGFMDKATEEATADLEAFAKKHQPVLTAKAVLRTGSPQYEINEMAREMGADLIIIASHKPGMADYLLGSVAAAVVRHAPCSVLVHR